MPMQITTPKTAKADLHVHSKHSSQPDEWYLRQLRAPECYTEPREVYRLCRERGMDFVTISDHDTIDGALEIAHLPGTFLSCEVTVEFPTDGCQVHCLVTGISEAQHHEIQRLRRNVYDFRDYLMEEGIVHSVAHPLYRVNDRLTLDHFEKLLVLFNRFEALNGIHERRANEMVRRILGALTPETLASLAERHRLAPVGATPWIKSLTGGSDDHGGFFVATTYTETPAAATVEEFLAHLDAGRHHPGGETGSSLRLVQSLYGIAWQYYRRQFPWFLGNRNDPFAVLLRTLAQGPAASGDRRTVMAARKAQRESLAKLARGVLRPLRRGRLAECLAAVSHLAPLALSAAPYVMALRAQHKDAGLLESASLRFLGEPPEAGRPIRKAWFTDTLTGLGGMDVGPHLTALVCGSCDGAPPTGLPVHAFEPLLEVPIPGGGTRKLAVPPLLEILEHCERERYAEIVIGTPGPIGLAGLAAGKLLGIPLAGVYPADFPPDVLRLFGSPGLEDAAWAYLRWFYGQMDRVVVPDPPVSPCADELELAGVALGLEDRAMEREIAR
ncbi:MAG TPA: hypothetical protein VF173_10850 [Thermoanaerobaculia bacterium]|nr:hypothetical protein [Thermoanaerobaculia bacterium]